MIAAVGVNKLRKRQVPSVATGPSEAEPFYMTLETIRTLSDNPSSTCQNWQPDHPPPGQGLVFLHDRSGTTLALGRR
jgi:hypothetical protein